MNQEPPPIGYHVMCRLQDGRIIAPTHEARITVAKIVLEKFEGHRLLAFNAPDTHLHLEHNEEEKLGTELIRRVQIAIRLKLGLPVGFTKPFPKPIRSQGHLFSAFDYILKQQPHHGLEWDPYREASNLPDLLGVRMLGQYTADNVRERLPRVKRPLLLTYLGVETLDQRDGPLGELLAATLAATGLPHLHGRSGEARGARRAALAVVDRRLTLEQTAGLLETDRKSLWRAMTEPVDGRLVRAIRLQLGLRELVRAAPRGAFADAATR